MESVVELLGMDHRQVRLVSLGESANAAPRDSKQAAQLLEWSRAWRQQAKLFVQTLRGFYEGKAFNRPYCFECVRFAMENGNLSGALLGVRPILEND